MSTSKGDLLNVVQKIVRDSDFGVSRERGKRFYPTRELPDLLRDYMLSSGWSLAATARALDLGPSSLTRILKGDDISENMLFRIRYALELTHSSSSLDKGSNIYPGDWRGTQKESIQAAIGVVTEKLIFLRDSVLESNSINSSNAPIDSLQVAQLLALLNSMLSALQAPFVEARTTGGFFRWLGSIARKGAERGLEGKISDAFSAAIAAGKKLIDVLMNSSGPPDLGGLGV